MDSKVHIIVPVYNAEKYVERCIKSLTGQNHKNIKIWLVDDCSTDNSFSVCSRCATEDERIILLKTDVNSGAGKARNCALNKIFENGCPENEFIAFVDSDDYVSADYVSGMMAIQKESDADIVWTENFTVKDSKEAVFYENENEGSTYVTTGKALLMQEKQRIMYSMLWAKLYKIKLWKDNRIDETFRWYEDGASTFKVIYLAEKMAISEKKYYYYCYSANSSVRSALNTDRMMCGLETAVKKIEFYRELNEKALESVAYLGYLNDILNNMMNAYKAEDGKTIYKDMWKLYKKNYKKGVSCKHISAVQRSKYLIYRVFPNIRSVYIKVKCKIRGYN